MPIELTTDPPDGIHQQRLDVHLTHPRRPLEPPAAVGGKPADVFGKPTDLRYALAGFSACEALGVLHTTSPRVLDVHVTGGLAEVLRTWSLEQVDARDADLVLRPTRMTRSVFGGCVERDGVQVVDALQAALDVVGSPARGTEQAEYIVRHVLQLGEES
jgi:hypothetical protein